MVWIFLDDWTLLAVAMYIDEHGHVLVLLEGTHYYITFLFRSYYTPSHLPIPIHSLPIRSLDFWFFILYHIICMFSPCATPTPAGPGRMRSTATMQMHDKINMPSGNC
jgi:hypothetical protein